MKVLIPMAGTGNRFVQKGYQEPKPLIKVDDKRIIEYILEVFTEDDDIFFICNKTHLLETEMSKILLEIRPDATVLEIDNHKKGPIFTILPFFDLIDDEEDVMVCYCDNPFTWNRKSFFNYVGENRLDGCILTHTGMHPHTLNSTRMAFLKIDEESGLLKEIKEKESYTDDPMSEHASTGAYYFSCGKDMKQCFLDCSNKGVNYNGEYYVTLAYNCLVQSGKRIGYYDSEYVTVFGTPEELQSYQAWHTILNSGQVKGEEDLLKCYHYWRGFHERK